MQREPGSSCHVGGEANVQDANLPVNAPARPAVAAVR